MSVLIATIGQDKESWMSVEKIISTKNFSKVFIVTNKYGHENFNPKEISEVTIDFLVLDFNNETLKLVDELSNGIKGIFKEEKIFDLDIAINIASGNGKMHTIVISAVLKSGYGIRFVELDSFGKIKELI